MNPTVQRGRLLFMIAVALLILERLAIAGLALSNFNTQQLNWTSVVLPLTHIAVAVFLIFTSDVLIYWLVIMWGIITTSSFAYMLVDRYRKLEASEQPLFFSKYLPAWWPLVALIAFHLVITLCFLMPSIRAYLAYQRSKSDFAELPSSRTPTE